MVTKFIDPNDSLCSEDDYSLRESIQSSNYYPGVQVNPLLAGTYILPIAGIDLSSQGDFNILRDVTIIGEDSPVIDADGIDRMLQITNAANVTMEGL